MIRAGGVSRQQVRAARIFQVLQAEQHGRRWPWLGTVPEVD